MPTTPSDAWIGSGEEQVQSFIFEENILSQFPPLPGSGFLDNSEPEFCHLWRVTDGSCPTQLLKPSNKETCKEFSKQCMYANITRKHK